jgi:hypothetical protein
MIKKELQLSPSCFVPEGDEKCMEILFGKSEGKKTFDIP